MIAPRSLKIMKEEKIDWNVWLREVLEMLEAHERIRSLENMRSECKLPSSFKIKFYLRCVNRTQAVEPPQKQISRFHPLPFFPCFFLLSLRLNWCSKPRDCQIRIKYLKPTWCTAYVIKGTVRREPTLNLSWLLNNRQTLAEGNPRVADKSLLIDA